jgi:hypothetical protein
MNWFLFGVFVTVAVAMVVPAIWRKEYRLQFPCLAGLTVIYQIALPLASLNTQPNEVSAASLRRFSVMAILCLLAAWAGYEWRWISKHPALMRFDPRRLVASALILVALGGVFTWRYSAVTPEFDPEKGGMTGIATIYLTLAFVGRYGAILAAIVFMRAKDWLLLVLVLPQLWTYYQLFLIGRRGPTGEIMVVICMLLFFYRQWAIPFWLMLLGVFGMAVFCFNIGTIRATVEQPLSERIEAIRAGDPLDSLTLQGMARDRQFVEVFNAAKFMEAKAQGKNYTYGLHFWNQLVFGYVPAQIVGREFKESLKFPLTDDAQPAGFEKSAGTCETGIGEAFMAYSYFGCGLFFVLGAFMRWAWEGAIRKNILHQFVIMLCTLQAVMTFSSQLWAFVNLLASIALFAGPLLWWSRVHEGARVTRDGPEGLRERRLKWRQGGSRRSVGPKPAVAKHVEQPEGSRTR